MQGHRVFQRPPVIGKDVEPLQIDFKDAGNHGAVFDADPGDGYRIVEPAMAGASRIEIGYPIFFNQVRLMGMPADNHVDTGGRWFQVQLIQVVEDIKKDAADLDHLLGRQ
jgi:hypothetical protein